jgi:hypothetical protein
VQSSQEKKKKKGTAVQKKGRGKRKGERKKRGGERMVWCVGRRKNCRVPIVIFSSVV